VIGVQSDRKGLVWILDMGGEDLSAIPPKLVAWDTRRDELHRVIHIPRTPGSTTLSAGLRHRRGGGSSYTLTASTPAGIPRPFEVGPVGYLALWGIKDLSTSG
jgi:hypothetical protein